jgi:hypothetical protein
VSTDTVNWQGEDALRPMLVPIEDVRPWPGNPRQGDVGAMCLSLERFGQYRPAVVQASTGQIAAGNHMWIAARQLGWTHLAVLAKDMDDTTARQLLLADNRVADRGTYDQDALAGILRDLAERDELDPATGYDLDDLDDLLAQLDNSDPIDVPGRRPRGGSDETGPPPPAASSGGEVVREVTLLVPLDDLDTFNADVAVLTEAWGAARLTEVALRALSECAERVRDEA